MTSTAEPATQGELSRAAFHTLFVERDVEAARRFWDESSVDHFLAQGISARGPDELADFFHGLLAAVPDLRMEIVDLAEGRDHATVQWRLTGTFSGAAFVGIEPTGRSLDLRGCDCFRWTDRGTVDTNTVYSDGAEFARQVGLLPARDSVTDRAMLGAFNLAGSVRRRLRR